MSALSLYTDLSKAARNARVTSPSYFANDVSELDYEVLRRMMMRDNVQMFQAGPRIEDDVILDHVSTAEEFGPNPTFSYTNPQILSHPIADWRYTHDHQMVTQQELELGQGGSPGQIVKNLMLSKEIRMVNSLVSKLKAQRFATPQTTQQEAQAGLSPYPLAAGVNEFVGTTDNGISTGYTTGTLQTQFHPGTTGDATEWTTFQGVSIAAKANWRNKVAAYTSQALGAGVQNVFAAFLEMWTMLKFKAPPVFSQYYQNEMFRRLVIATTRKGFLTYSSLLLAMGDNVRAQNMQDPAMVQPMFANIPVEHWDGLGAATWYSANANVTTGAVTTEGQAFNKGPRYYWLNFNFIKMIFHFANYFERTGWRMPGGDKPYTKVQDAQSWNNQWFISRRNHGVVLPVGAGFAAY